MSRSDAPFPRSVHRLLLRLQRGLCAGCAGPATQFNCSVDHVIPVRLKGFHGFGNLVAMHGWCNRAKGGRPPTGCELIWLMAVNARLGVGPQTWRVA